MASLTFNWHQRNYATHNSRSCSPHEKYDTFSQINNTSSFGEWARRILKLIKNENENAFRLDCFSFGWRLSPPERTIWIIDSITLVRRCTVHDGVYLQFSITTTLESPERSSDNSARQNFVRISIDCCLLRHSVDSNEAKQSSGDRNVNAKCFVSILHNSNWLWSVDNGIDTFELKTKTSEFPSYLNLLALSHHPCDAFSIFINSLYRAIQIQTANKNIHRSISMGCASSSTSTNGCTLGTSVPLKI